MAATATADPINQVFRALADPTRSRIVERLSRGAASEGELARLFDMALPSFVQHLRVLKECGLMRSKMMGRVRVVHVVPRHISVAPTWLDWQRDLWERCFDQLDELLII